MRMRRSVGDEGASDRMLQVTSGLGVNCSQLTADNSLNKQCLTTINISNHIRRQIYNAT